MRAVPPDGLGLNSVRMANGVRWIQPGLRGACRGPRMHRVGADKLGPNLQAIGRFDPIAIDGSYRHLSEIAAGMGAP